jgi:hypothetical protein
VPGASNLNMCSKRVSTSSILGVEVTQVTIAIVLRAGPLMRRVHFSMKRKPALGSTQHSVLRIPVAVSPRVKWEGREGDHSLPSNAEVKNGGAIPQLSNTSLWLVFTQTRGQLHLRLLICLL